MDAKCIIIEVSYKMKKFLKNWRFILLVVLLVLSIVALAPNPVRTGAAIRSVDRDSAAFLAGIQPVSSTIRPMDRPVITAVSVNDDSFIVVNDAQDYFNAVQNLSINESVTIRTNKGTYFLTVLPEISRIELNQTEFITEEILNVTTNEFENVTREVQLYREEVIGVAPLGLTVYDAPTSNIRKGLDIQGGTRVLLEPETRITPDQFDSIASNLETRLNVFGLADVEVSVVQDFQFNPEFILIEIAGTTVDEIEELVSSQGLFQAKIGDDVVFEGERRDITFVGKGPTDTSVTCSRGAGGFICNFQFAITLSPEAARRQASITSGLGISTEDPGFLSQPLDLFLDGVLVNSLQIASDLRGRSDITQISISGSGTGSTQNEAIENATRQMNQLQTVIETGSIPTRLNIVKVDTISPVLGANFLFNALLAGLAAIVAVGIVLFIRYRTLKIVIPMVLALIAEVILIIGSSVIINWTLDLAAIAGMIIAIGTGIDHLVVITDEVRKKEELSWQSHIKRAFAIVLGAYLTTMFAMAPLLVAGAGLLRGFAITTMLGLTFGVFITRPVYAKVIEELNE
ncbi:MAG: hypothetical protein ACMXYK_03675 [Candidatus Woesearchaeota archaeon]